MFRTSGIIPRRLHPGPLALTASVWRQPDRRPRAVGVPFLALLALGAPASFRASFGPAFALTDTHFISGRDTAHVVVDAQVVVCRGGLDTPDTGGGCGERPTLPRSARLVVAMSEPRLRLVFAAQQRLYGLSSLVSRRGTGGEC